MLIDTHAHLYLSEFEKDIDSIISNAQQKKISKIYLPAIDSESHQGLLQLEEKFPDFCLAMMGLHPCYVKENYKDELSTVEKLLKSRDFMAIGECGLDFYWDKTFVSQQYEALEQQIAWALQYQIPIVLHTRNATQETIEVIKRFADKGLRGVFHCFGGSLSEAQQIIEMGFLLGIGGVVTYKNSGLDKVLAEIDLRNIVLETDAPYLSPVPHRGKRNESAYLSVVAEKIALIKNCDVEEVASVTTSNATLLFAKK